MILFNLPKQERLPEMLEYLSQKAIRTNTYLKWKRTDKYIIYH